MMSSRPQSGKFKRTEKDQRDNDVKNDFKAKFDTRSDLKTGRTPHPAPTSGAERSPARGRGDRGFRERPPKGPPPQRRRDDDKSDSYRGGKFDQRNGDREYIVDRRQGIDGRGYFEDIRLSKLMRKVAREDDRDKRISALTQLQDFICYPENNKVITKAVESLLTSLQEVLLERTHRDVRQEAAVCIGCVGFVTSNDAQRYFDWIFTKFNASGSEEARSLYIIALLETFKQDEEQGKLTDYTPDVLAQCQRVLENAESPDVLAAIISMILHLARVTPAAFANHFRDTVDILVGWHIEPSQKENLTSFTSHALIKLRDFWLNDMTFSVTLMGQFLEDMEAYTEDLAVGLSGKSDVTEEDMPPPAECVTKLTALLWVFCTVSESLGEYFTVTRGPPITSDLLAASMQRVIKCVITATKAIHSETVLTAANQCLVRFVEALGEEVIHHRASLLELIQLELECHQPVASNCTLSLLHLLHHVVKTFNTQLPIPFIDSMLGPKSLIRGLRFTLNKEILEEVVSLHHVILGIKNVPLLEEAYRYVLGDLELALSVLMEVTGSGHQCPPLVANNLLSSTYTPRQAETVLVFSMSVLAELSNTKNNIIGMWALSPSIFDLLTRSLLVEDTRGTLERYPVVHYAFLHTLFSHSSRHEHFLSTSQLIAQGKESAMMMGVKASTGSHFATVLSLVTNQLAHTNASWDVKCLLLKWTYELCEILGKNQSVYAQPEFLQLITAVIVLGYEKDAEVALRVEQCLQGYLSHTEQPSPVLLHSMTELCGVKMQSIYGDVQVSFTHLMHALPVNITTSMPTTMVSASKAEKKSSSRRGPSHIVAKRLHMSRMPSGNFHSHNFRVIMAHLLDPDNKGKMWGSWLPRVYHSCRGQEQASGELHSLLSLFGDSVEMLWFWASWEAAQFCVLAKLRTPLGKPQETFTSIEGALKRHLVEIKRSQEDSDGPVNPHDGSSSGVEESLSRVHVLLMFMEHLEKQLYNAYEGSASAMVTLPKAVRTFFRTNRNTCHEWLTRVRLSIMKVAHESCHAATVIRHGFQLLRDMKEQANTQVAEFDQVLLLVAQAMCDVKSPDALHGLFAWCRDIDKRKLPWIKATALIASGRFEAAIAEFKAILNSASSDKSGSCSPEKASPAESPLGSPPHDDIISHAVILSSLNAGKHDSVSTTGKDTDPALVNFAVNKVCESYVSVRGWTEALEWQDSLQQYRLEHSPTPLHHAFNTHTDINYLKALQSFDELKFDKAAEHLELVPGLSLNSAGVDIARPCLQWNPNQLVSSAQKQLLRAVTLSQSPETKHNMELVHTGLDQCVSWCKAVLLHGVADGGVTSRHQQGAATLVQAASVIKNLFSHTSPKEWLPAWCDGLSSGDQPDNLAPALTILSLTKLQQHLASQWMDDQTPSLPDFSGMMSRLRLVAVNTLRKQGNLRKAEGLLIEEISACVVPQSDMTHQSAKSVLDALSKVHMMNLGLNQLHLIKMERLASKLLHDQGHHRDAIETISASVAAHSQSGSEMTGGHKSVKSDFCEYNARSLLTLVKWLQLDYKYLGQVSSQVRQAGQGDDGCVSVMARNLKVMLEMEVGGYGLESNAGLTEGDTVIGHLLQLSTNQCPGLAKSWFVYAGWCYKWGRKAVDNAIHGNMELSTDEKAQVLDILPKGTSHDEVDTVLSILGQIHAGVGDDEDIIDQDQSLYDEGGDMTRRQLLAGCMSLQIASDNCIDLLIGIWRGGVKRVYQHYHQSATAYFTYLKLQEEGEDNECNEDGHMTATLRLLRLLVKHAWELRGVLEGGLASTPTSPWKGIIPQLFSRLNHPEPYVRQSVSELLCRVAQDAPHLIVYPAVVGSSSAAVVHDDSSLRPGLLSDYLSQGKEADGGEEKVDPVNPDNEDDGEKDEDEEEEDEDHVNNTALLQNCFSGIVDTLAKSNPRMIAEVELLVSELRRITLLWDELWLGALNQHAGDITRHLKQLEYEVKKVMAIAGLDAETKAAIIKEKHKTVLKPTLYAMERLHDITSQAPETPHERLFQETYGSLITQALQRLQNPVKPANPASSWQLFKQFHTSLQQRAQKRSSLALEMEKMSGKLHNLSHTVIAMPGINSHHQVVTIKGIANAVHILPTKTKPKKLMFLGSDGKKYVYLFKGLEDLHLDERIMQFLNIVNNMFVKTNSEKHLYHACHYSVTPLGARSGLIQWVDGATPLFSLYKRWQQREALAQQAKQGTAASGNTPAIARPSEVFYNVLTPALQEKGITNLDSRKEWPLSVMRKVLQQLEADTPSDLLAKELWCSSTEAMSWWRVTQVYSRSTAVMSIIGYIIGLGDRHLDNVLVDLISGEVVHIDYNVCFEKGRSLRVPEKVPFRMTQNIECAMGVTGVEGVFRLACEHVLKTLRRGRETLLTLLEAFVYDPLVDWTTGNEGGYAGSFYGGRNSTCGPSKKHMEREITRSMFAIRVAEMKPSWLGNKEEMLLVLPQLEESVRQCVRVNEKLVEVQHEVEALVEQHYYLEEARSSPQHPAFTLALRNQEHGVVAVQKRGAMEAIRDMLGEARRWSDAHWAMVGDLRAGSSLKQLCSELSQPSPAVLQAGAANFTPVVEFLQGAGQSQLVSQCEQALGELCVLLEQRHAVLRACVDFLLYYTTIISHLPPSYVSNHRSSRISDALQHLTDDLTTTRCQEVKMKMEKMSVSASAASVLEMDGKLKNQVSDISSRIVKLMERRNQEGADAVILDSHVQEATNAVQHYILKGGVAAEKCMRGVVSTALCALAKRYLLMESAASTAGERLVDLTSREGDWFLHELCSMTANLNHLLSLLADSSQGEPCKLLEDGSKAMLATHRVYMALQELNINFRSIILPEALKSLQAEEPSVVVMVNRLGQIVTSAPRPLETIISDLEVLLRNAIMGVKVCEEEEDAVTVARDLRAQFTQLTDRQQTDTTSGQMLLMGFSGLFTQLDTKFGRMLEATKGVEAPDVWRKVDVVREARAIQLTAFKEDTLPLLAHLFFVKQLKATHDFFILCQKTADTLNDASIGEFYDEERSARPVKHFIAEYVRRHLIGLASQVLGYIICDQVNLLHVDITAEIELRDIGAECKVSLDELCKKAIDGNLKNRRFEHFHLTQASALLGATDVAWRKSDLARRLETNTGVLKTSLQRAQLQLARHQWLHEGVLPQAGLDLTALRVSQKSTLLAEIAKHVATLEGHSVQLTPIQDHHKQLELSVAQRLKWAAGANPSLLQVAQSYEEAQANKDAVIQCENVVASKISGLCTTILHLETLRSHTPESLLADTTLLNLIHKCEETCRVVEACKSHVDVTEGNLLKIQPLEVAGNVEQWIELASPKVNDRIELLQNNVASLMTELDEAKECVKGKVGTIRGVLTTHHKLMSDIRTILKSLAKQEDQDYGHWDPSSPPDRYSTVRDYVNAYKVFSENFTGVLKLVMTDRLEEQVLSDVEAMMGTLRTQIISIYDDLVNFAPALSTSDVETEQQTKLSFANAVKKQENPDHTLNSSPIKTLAPLPLRSDYQGEGKASPSTASPSSTLPSKMQGVKKLEKVTRDPRTGKAIQERNSYAVGVWRRVKMKLDGRDPDSNKRLSVPDQVDYVIKEATNLDNLALLYEGWTPWV